MDPIGNPHDDFDHPMEPSVSDVVKEPSNPGSVNIFNFEDEQQLHTLSLCSIADYGRPTPLIKPKGMDGLTGVQALPGRAHGHAFVALPDVFDG
jgi:hypothetical protein